MDSKKISFTDNTTILTYQKIIQSFNENIFELSHIRTDWSIEYAQQLKSRIEEIIAEHLPHESSIQHTEKQQYVHDLMLLALKENSLLRALIKVEFKDDPEFRKMVFEELGYNDLFSDAKNGDYQSLYHLVENFSKNMTPAIRERLISKSIPIAMIDRMIDLYPEIQEFKTCLDLIYSSRQLSEEGKLLVNELFSEINDICRVATAYYMLDSVKRDQFSFFRVMHRLKQSITEPTHSKHRD